MFKNRSNILKSSLEFTVSLTSGKSLRSVSSLFRAAGKSAMSSGAGLPFIRKIEFKFLVCKRFREIDQFSNGFLTNLFYLASPTQACCFNGQRFVPIAYLISQETKIMHDITKDADLWTHATKQHVCYKTMILRLFPVTMIIHTVPSRKLTLNQRWATKWDATLQIVSTRVF